MPTKNRKTVTSHAKSIIITEKLAVKLRTLSTDYYHLLGIEIASSLNDAELKKEYKKKRREVKSLGYELDKAIEK